MTIRNHFNSYVYLLGKTSITDLPDLLQGPALDLREALGAPRQKNPYLLWVGIAEEVHPFTICIAYKGKQCAYLHSRLINGRHPVYGVWSKDFRKIPFATRPIQWGDGRHVNTLLAHFPVFISKIRNDIESKSDWRVL